MKRILYDNTFMTISLFAGSKSLEVEVKPESVQYTERTYREDQLCILQFVEKYRPSTVQVDLKHLDYSIMPSLQAWTAQNVIAPAADFGLQRIAHIMPKDFIANLSIEQLEKEVQCRSSAVEICIFKSKEEALPWLNAVRQNAA